MRQAVNSLESRRMLNYLDQSDPVMALLEYLERMARQSRTVPPLYLEVRRLFTQHFEDFLAEATPEHLRTAQTSSPAIEKAENLHAGIPRLEVEQTLQMPARRKAING
jgi:hypothetical protein